MDVSAVMRAWHLIPDGDVIRTASSEVIPVRSSGRAAMLKVSRVAEEARGHTLMTWLDGDGAARVYRHEGSALLMERLEGRPSLAGLALAGDDDRATRILVSAAQAVHRARPAPWPALPPLRTWFRSLGVAAAGGGDYGAAWAVARALLDEPQGVRPLHGDIHHGNVLWSPGRGWVVIDPKGVIGEAAYDFANLLCNPTPDLALAPGRLERQVGVVVAAGGPPRERLLAWVQAYTGLSAAWSAEDGHATHADQALALSRAAAGLLARART
jgi:streptomycin 6-kinase